MPKVRFTTKFIESAQPHEGRRIEYWDSVVSDDVSLPGSLGLRVSEKGVKAWVVMYRVRGAQKRMTLGRFPALPLSSARELARQALISASRGEDPSAPRLKQNDRPLTLEAAVAQFVERYARARNRSWKETARILDRHLVAPYSDVPIADIGGDQIDFVLDGIVDAGNPVMANRTLAAFRTFFRWCVERRILEKSPVTSIAMPSRERSRDRTLNDDELVRLWRGTDEIGWPFGPFYKILLLTGQRRSEVATMRWDDLQAERSIWIIPKERSKSDREHVVPLSDPALAILSSLPVNGDFVFTTTGVSPVSGFSLAKSRIDIVSGVSDWRLHDIRRTVASGMAYLGVAPHVVEKVLNHSSGTISGVAAVYNRYNYFDEKRQALRAWGDRLMGNVNGQ